MTQSSKDQAMARRLAEEVARAGGRAYYVGGYVRDRLRGETTKDIDVEVHGLTPQALGELLDGLGTRLEVGASFGIFGLKGYHLDIALPRREKATGRGHRDFAIQADPFCTPAEAARRRDFTVNAMMEDVLTGELLDPYGGREDLARRLLRRVDPRSFPEDPLRVLRGAQFAARFGFALEEETAALCRTIPLDTLSPERVMGEMEKALLKGEKPSVFFSVLRDLGQLDWWFPQGKALIGVPQNPVYHQEGDVWDHTMLVVDQAAAFRGLVQEPLSLMLAAFCHDFGKPETTERESGAFHAYGHEEVGAELTRVFLGKLTREKKLTRQVENLVALHMKPNTLAFHAGDRVKVKSTNKLFDQALCPEELIYLAVADHLGCRSPHPEPPRLAFLQDRLQVYRETMARPHVTGKDLLAQGVPPGEIMGESLAYAHKLRLAGVEREGALKATLAFAKKLGQRPKG